MCVHASGVKGGHRTARSPEGHGDSAAVRESAAHCTHAVRDHRVQGVAPAAAIVEDPLHDIVRGCSPHQAGLTPDSRAPRASVRPEEQPPPPPPG